MNLPFEITLLWERLASPAGYRLSLSLIHFLWQGFVIALVAALFIRVLGRGSPHRRYAIGLAGLLAMAVAPVATFFLITPPAPPPEVTFTGPAIPATAALDAGEIPPDDLTHEIHRLDALIQHMESELNEPTTLSAQIPPEPQSWFDLLREWQPYLLLLWLAGTSVCALRLAIGAQASWRYRLGRKPLPEAARETLINLAQRLGVKPPRVFVSERVLEAIVVGLFRPMILLPAAWIGRIPPELLEAVLAHEIAHLRRHDLWINLAQRLLETLLFYHPALWWLSRRVRLEREFCCDEIAAQALDCRAAYARALEFVAAERLLASRLATLDTALVAGMGGDEMALLNRVRRVLGRDPLPGRFRWRWATGGALLLPFCLWGVFLWADSFWTNSFAWAGGEGKPPVVAEQPAAASEMAAEAWEMAAEATPADDMPDFERATGASLLDEGVVVAVICRTSATLGSGDADIDGDVMRVVSNLLHRHGVAVRQPDQVEAWIESHPNLDGWRPEDIGEGVEATHVVDVELSQYRVFAEHKGIIDHGRAKGTVSVVAKRPDGNWNKPYEQDFYDFFSVATHRYVSGPEESYSFFRRQFLPHLSDKVGRLFYNAMGDDSIDIEADPFGLAELAPPDGDPASDDPFAGLSDKPFAKVADGVDSQDSDKGDRRDSPFASGDATPPSDESAPDPFGTPAEAEEPEGAAANRELEDLRKQNAELQVHVEELAKKNSELWERLEAISEELERRANARETVEPSEGFNPPSEAPASERDEAAIKKAAKLLADTRRQLEEVKKAKGPTSPEAHFLEMKVTQFHNRLLQLQSGHVEPESVPTGPAAVPRAGRDEASATSDLSRELESESKESEEDRDDATREAELKEQLNELRKQLDEIHMKGEAAAPAESEAATKTNITAHRQSGPVEIESGKAERSGVSGTHEASAVAVETKPRGIDDIVKELKEAETALIHLKSAFDDNADDHPWILDMELKVLDLREELAQREAERREFKQSQAPELPQGIPRLLQDLEPYLRIELEQLRRSLNPENGIVVQDVVTNSQRKRLNALTKLLIEMKKRAVERQQLESTAPPLPDPGGTYIQPAAPAKSLPDPAEAAPKRRYPSATFAPEAPPIPDNENWRSLGPPAGPTRATPRGPLMVPGEFKVTMSRDGNVAIVVFHDAAFGAEITYSVPAEKLAALLEQLSKQAKSEPVPLPDDKIRWGDPQITLPMKGPEPAVPNYENPSADDGFSEPPSEENSDDRPLGSPPGEGFRPVPSKSKPNEKKETSLPPATFE